MACLVAWFGAVKGTWYDCALRGKLLRGPGMLPVRFVSGMSAAEMSRFVWFVALFVAVATDE